MAIKTKAGTAGQAAALPVADELNAVIDAAGNLYNSIAYDLQAVLSAAENLADCRRVLEQISDHADAVPEFDTQVRESSHAWRNPQVADGYELIQGLLRVAGHMCQTIGQQADTLHSKLHQVSRVQQGGGLT